MKNPYRQLKTISKQYAIRHLRKSIQALQSMPPKQRRKVEGLLDDFLAAIPTFLTDAQKAALLYYVFTSRIRYDTEGRDKTKLAYSFISALCRQKAVCMGIAELYCYMANRLGVKCRVVCGYVTDAGNPTSGGLHAWVMIRLNGCWYHADPTFDLHGGIIPGWRPKWFLLSDQEMDRHYWITADYPACKKIYSEQIQLNQKGVQILCKHWENLISEFPP